MEARVSVHNKVAIIHLSGRVDFDSQEMFRQACLRNLSELKVVFDMSHLSFVGSNAITPLVQTLTEISQVSKGLRMFGVGSEFSKIFKASEIRELYIFEDVMLAMESFHFIESPQPQTMGSIESDQPASLQSVLKTPSDFVAEE